ncbi:MAG: hypothetical protein IKH03_00160 [Oscillospiraceae bacterium]|nr:hypothetical protein [Oscillospiraceae bacterium]
MKTKLTMVCNVVSMILVVLFAVKSIIDYTQYKTTLNSAPFYVWILLNALYFIIPAILVFVIGFIAKKKL